MELTKDQEKLLRACVTGGKTLGEIQAVLKEAGAILTYMELRLLIDDLGLAVAEHPRGKTIPPMPQAETPPDANAPEEGSPQEGGGVTLSIDKLVRPGALLSGEVVFSDGTKVQWALDEMGRLGLMGAPKGYQPPAADLPEFQNKLRAAIEARGGI